MKVLWLLWLLLLLFLVIVVVVLTFLVKPMPFLCVGWCVLVVFSVVFGGYRVFRVSGLPFIDCVRDVLLTSFLVSLPFACPRSPTGRCSLACRVCLVVSYVLVGSCMLGRVCDGVCYLLGLCARFTSPPGGNQVDGLPPASSKCKSELRETHDS